MSKEIRLQVCSVPKNLVTSVMRGSNVAWYDIIQFVYLSPLVSDIELEPDIKNAFVFNNEETAKILAQSCGGEVLPMDKNIC